MTAIQTTSRPAALLDGLNIRCQHEVPLAPLTWYRVGGPAQILARPASTQQLTTLVARCHTQGVRSYVLGSGANLLVSDQGVRGVVVRLDAPFFRQMTVKKNRVTVGAGYDLPRLVLETARAGLSGLECLAGIPGSVGGAARMNAGGVFGDIGAVVSRVMVCDACGQVYYRDRDDLVFSYRKTNIVAPYILEVEFDLSPADPDEVMTRVKAIFMHKKNSQPLAEHSAGCAFKNPPRPADGSAPTPTAGQLIDRAALKGFRVGGAEVSTRHANFIVTHPGCTARDVLDVLEHIQDTVWEQMGIRLEREIVVWP